MVDHVHGVNSMGGMHPAKKIKNAYRMSEPAKATDSVEISSEVMRLKGIEGVRMDKVMAIRSQVNDGTYFTPEKLDKALDAALNQLMGV